VIHQDSSQRHLPNPAGGSSEVARPPRPGDSSSAFEEPDQDVLATFPLGLDRASLEVSVGENLPHWTCRSAVYHVTFRLADSLPIAVRDAWLREREVIVAKAGELGNGLSEDEEKRLDYLYSEKVGKALDAGHGACWLARQEVASTVANALAHFEGERHTLHAWCIMPSHVHVIVQPLAEHGLSAIIHSWKSFTAHAANRILRRHGDFWQHDAYNHIIRSAKEYCFQLRYVWGNPEQAGLRNWPWREVAAAPPPGPERTDL
jgi:REP element-mobilizing transposase RayT